MDYVDDTVQGYLGMYNYTDTDVDDDTGTGDLISGGRFNALGGAVQVDPR